MGETIKEVNVLDSYISDMQIHAIATNRRQTVPDYKDGLKSVGRRVLITMFDKNLFFNRPRIKSAGVVGSCMEKYHPHGDCIRGSSVLYTLAGEFLTIEEIYNRKLLYVDILSVDPSTGNVVPARAHSFRIGQYTNKEYHVVLSNGAEVVCTDNHPFMVGGGAWVKAKDIQPNTRLYTAPLRLNGRPAIKDELIQNMVYKTYYGELPKGYQRHHKDFNPYNNVPENIVGLTEEQHKAIHGVSPASLNNLRIGREKMFSENGEYRNKIRRKNSELCKAFNTDQGLRRFKHAINLLKEQGLPITIDAYESLRATGQVYNLPYVDRLLNKYPDLGSSFEDLVNAEIPTLGELYEQNKVGVSDLVKRDTQVVNNSGAMSMVYRFTMYRVFDIMLDAGIPLTVENYFNCRVQSTADIDPEILSGIMALYAVEYPYVVNVYTVDVDNQPMYDFTVDGYENMLIPVYNNTGSGLEDMLGAYAPMICIHNSSIYDVMCIFSRWWDCKIPLLDGHGNYGNMQGDGAAAMRYTETRLSEFATEAVIGDLQVSKDVVDWVPNFDESDMEPEYLPCKIPLLLINGTFGIGIGMRAEISRHNITEVLDATINLIKNPKADVVLIPDHCMPCDIIDTNWKRISNTGFGTYRCRGRIDIETDKKGYPLLVIKSVPDMVTLFVAGANKDEGVIAKVDEMIKEGKIPQIRDRWDESSKTDMRFVIQLQKGSNPVFVREFLYKHTLLEKPFRENFEVLDGITPLRMSYKSYLQAFIEFYKSNKYRSYYAQLAKVKTKWREKQLYLMVMNSGEIRDIQDKIRKRKDVSPEKNAEFMEYLIKKFNVTDIEAKFIMHMDMMKTAEGYRRIYEADCKKYEEEIQYYLNKITNESLIEEEIIEELTYFRNKYKTPRLCRVIKDTMEDVPAGDFLIVVTENNYIKKLNLNDNINTYRGDAPKLVLKVDNRDNVLLFDKNGKVFKLPVSKVDMCDKNSAGFDLRVMIKNCTSDIMTVMNESTIQKISKSTNKNFLTVLTSQGCIKKMDLDDFLNVPPSGIIYTKLGDGDFVKDITIIPNDFEVIIYSHKKAIRYGMDQIPHYKRTAQGVGAMSSKEPIDGISVILPSSQYVVVVTESGRINKFAIAGLPSKKRNQAGSSVIKLSKTDSIVNIFGVDDSMVLKVGTKTGMTTINVSDIPLGSSISAGQKMIPTKSDSILKVRVEKPKEK